MLPPNTLLQNRYRIVQQLGSGGMGAVYQAMDENLSCVVAVKETFASMEEQRRAFKREAELLANLAHPALPRVTDHFNYDNGQFLVMQYVAGNDLAELLTLRERPFPTAKVMEWADQLLDALDELHSYQPPIIHRDIKPANLKLTPRGKIMLLDFGLAKGIAGQMSTIEGEHSGLSVYGYTRQYAPLEQIRGAGTDPRSDLYSLGATLWTLLTGQIPPDALARIDEKEEEKPDPLHLASDLNPEVPREVAAVLHQAMAINRNARPKSAAAMRDALKGALNEGSRRLAGYSQNEAEAHTLQQPAPTSMPNTSGPLEMPPTSAAPPPPQPSGAQRASAPASLPGQERAKTIVAPRPTVPPLSYDQGTSPDAYDATHGGGRKVLLAIIALAVVLAGAVTIWLMSPGGSDKGETAGQRQTGERAGEQGSRPTPPSGMVYVPGGEFMMGRDKADGGDEYERPAHKVTVRPFYMDQYEVRNEEYAKFLKATNHRAPTTWAGGTFPAGAGQTPVTGVTWDDANDYAKWAGKRLPTEEEWEFAARGTDGRRYPWGNDWKPDYANAESPDGRLRSSGNGQGQSPFGAYDMVGNAWEWTASELKAYAGGEIPPAPMPLRVIRGGSYAESRNEATTTYRRGYPARGNYDYSKTGFRCAKDAGGSSK